MTEAMVPARCRTSWVASVLVVAATYFYFLIFAEFAFLELADPFAATPRRLRLLMLGLGAGGVTGAVLGAALSRGHAPAGLLRWALRACAFTAVLACDTTNFAVLFAAGVAVGLSLGVLTVALAANLRSAMSHARLGSGVGIGTGLAYAGCNLPLIFGATAQMQTLVAAIVAAAASFLPRFMSGSFAPPSRSVDFAPFQIAAWLTILLTLVWMDSAAFYVIQHTASFRRLTWETTATLWGNASVHLLAAIAAGLLLDRGWRAALVGAAALSLSIACLILNGTVPAFVPAVWFYAVGVSLYSTVLVEYPARSGEPWMAAIIFAVAGWLGSAFGIGMAQDLRRVPTGFVAFTVAVVVVALIGRRRIAGRAAAVLAGAFLVVNLRGNEIARGREVYIAEGCIHCHSQYVRPHSSADRELWGPSTPLRDVLAAAPPLFGNRRQGPDLSHVGSRRSVEWNRLHLIAPQSVSPGSRMPSYSYLFKPGETRGDALLAYLMSCGADSFAERQARASGWAPAADTAIAPGPARQLFLRLCSPCHGESGRGDGPLAAQLSLRPVDWTQASWRHIPSDAPLETAVSRIIKFGLTGLPMAGHEYLPDAEIVGLARFVQTLHTKGSGRSPAALQP